MEQLSEKFFDFFTHIPKSLYIPIAIAGGGLILLSIGLIQLGNSKTISANPQTSTQEVQAHSPGSVQAASTSADPFSLHIDVEGAVVHPGVYVLPQNARVQEALVAAGGLAGNADRDFVAKSLNLAAKLFDGAKVYIPKMGETPTAGSSATANYAGSQVNLLDINSATADKLDNLPGVGPVTAQKIITGRPYQAVDDLLNKKIVSSSVFQKIKDLITVY